MYDALAHQTRSHHFKEPNNHGMTVRWKNLKNQSDAMNGSGSNIGWIHAGGPTEM